MDILIIKLIFLIISIIFILAFGSKDGDSDIIHIVGTIYIIVLNHVAFITLSKGLPMEQFILAILDIAAFFSNFDSKYSAPTNRYRGHLAKRERKVMLIIVSTIMLIIK